MRRAPRFPILLAALATAAALATSAALVACKESAVSRPTEEPFKLTEVRPLPSDSDAAAIPENAPVSIPSREDGEDEAAASGTRAVPLAELDAGLPRECPKERKVLPTDILITAEPRPRGGDAGAPAAEVRFVLQNRRAIPRSIQVTEIDRLTDASGVAGKAAPQRLRLTKVTFEEGGGGYADAKIMLHANATAHLIVEFEPAALPPWRAHIEVDGTPICVEGPGKRPF
jgi:hypothetical protein